MNNNINCDLSVFLDQFKLPAYEDIPDVGLYLEQTVKYINSFFKSFPGMELTGSMVSNYVKKGLIPNAVKKQYSRDQIAKLIFICATKLSVSIDGLALMLSVQDSTYPTPVAYEYFRLELMNILEYVFGRKDVPDEVGMEHTEQKYFLRAAVTAVAHKMYLDIYMTKLLEARRSEA